MLSNTGLSNMFTMGASAKNDARQAIPDTYIIPDPATCLLRARLLLEETLETINALGFEVVAGKEFICLRVNMKNVEFEPDIMPNLEGIIDGCCDMSYVAVGTMLSCGAPDDLHMNEVNRANNAKFPNGQAITDANGKFQKPKGWEPPNHAKHFNKDYMGILKHNPTMTAE